MKFLKSKINIIFLILGIVLFGWFVYKFGIGAIDIIKHDINFLYLSLFVLTVFVCFIPYSLRFKVILDSYGYNVNIFRLIKQHICTFAVSYITPASRLGGEPVRVYMLKKECGVDYKVGTTVVILDKFVEILGSALYGVIGLILLIVLFSIPLYFKIFFGFIVFLALFLLFMIYHRTINNKGVFSDLFLLLRLNKIKDWNKFIPTLKDIESKMSDFFKYHKKSFALSIMFYAISGILFIVEFKFLLLSIGMNASIFQLILAINVWGLTAFIPTPGSLGFLEAGQSGLFEIMQGNSAGGLAMILILRACYLAVVCIGFIFIIFFSGKQIIQNTKI